MLVEVDGKYMLIGSMWANPDIQIRNKTEVFDMFAREVSEPQQRQKLWTAVQATYPPYE